jgi:outer membrane PBP1 activator LpoA protein
MTTTLRVAQPSPHILAALAQAGATTDKSALEHAESLVEIAIGLQTQPKTPQDLVDAIYLYARAEELAGANELARARALAGRGVALRRMPGVAMDT